MAPFLKASSSFFHIAAVTILLISQKGLASFHFLVFGKLDDGMLVPYQSWDLFLLSCANRATHLFRRHEHYTETHYRKLLSFENTKLQEKNSQGCNAVIQEACVSRNMCERNRTNMRSTKHGWTHPSKCPQKQAKSAKFPHLVGSVLEGRRSHFLR